MSICKSGQRNSNHEFVDPSGKTTSAEPFHRLLLPSYQPISQGADLSLQRSASTLAIHLWGFADCSPADKNQANSDLPEFLSIPKLLTERTGTKKHSIPTPK